MSCTSGKFEADLFLMTNAVENFSENTKYEMFATEKFELADDATELTLSRKVAEDVNGNPIVSIAGLEIGEAAAQGVFVVDNTGDATKITFTAGDLGSNVQVGYVYYETVEEINIDNKASAIGEAIMQYPVYGSGDDCTQSSIVGYVNLKVYRARVTGQPGLDGSYKTASTFQFTLSALDAKRADEAVYSISYIQKPVL